MSSASRSISLAAQTDADMIEKIRAGDRLAFDSLYRNYYAELWKFAHQWVWSDDGAKDIVQDVFFSLWTRRTVWEVRTTVKAYLYGAVSKQALHVKRHMGVVRHTELRAVATGTPVAMGEPPLPADIRTDAVLLGETLRRAIQELPQRQGFALRLWWRDGMNTPEIAEALGISPQAARTLLVKARAKLLRLLEQKS